MNDLRRLRGRLGDYAIGALSALAAAAFYAGTVPSLIAAAVLILAALAVFAAQAIWAVQVNQIFREEIGGPGLNKGLGPKDFAMDLRVDPAALLYDLTVGFHDGDDPSVYRGLTQGELANKLAEHDVELPANAIRGRHTRAEDGLQLTWQPSTTDTTGETR